MSLAFRIFLHRKTDETHVVRSRRRAAQSFWRITDYIAGTPVDNPVIDARLPRAASPKPSRLPALGLRAAGHYSKPFRLVCEPDCRHAGLRATE